MLAKRLVFARSESLILRVNLQRLPTRSANCASLANGLPHVCFAAETGRTYSIEASSDLRHWENVGVALASDGALHFVDAETTNFTRRFYRLAPEPITNE